MPDDRLAAELASIRERHAADDYLMSCPCGRGEYEGCDTCPYLWCSVHGEPARLLAAVEAALKAADRWRHRSTTGYDTLAECADELRRVVAGELLSKEGHDD